MLTDQSRYHICIVSQKEFWKMKACVEKEGVSGGVLVGAQAFVTSLKGQWAHSAFVIALGKLREILNTFQKITSFT